jgi:ribosomal protein L40E
MTDPLPWLFAVGACAALGGALVALWASFRAAFGGAVPIELSSDVDHDARVRLLEEKESLLKNLADLRFDHEAGKISDADFERLDGKLRERTKTVLRLLDADVEPVRAEAERLIAGRLGGAPRDPFREVAPEKRESASAKSSEVSTTKKEKKSVREAMLAQERSSEESTTKKEKKEVREAVLAAQDELAAASKLDAPTVEPKADTKVCPSCATSNDVDAVFCKKCGHRFESAASASDAGEADASNESNESKGAEDER